MPENQFIKIYSVENIIPNHGIRILINEEDVAIFKTDNDVYAINNICPHNHTAKIYQGEILNGAVACPIHGWNLT